MGKRKGYLPEDEIERLANELLEQFSVTEPPVPVETIADGLDLAVEYTELGDDVSGLLVMSGETGTIGINKRDPRVRQRFSIAHEIGHYKLHAKSGDAVFIDKDYVQFRDERSAQGEIREEIQSNMFAACLLMPAFLLEQRIEEGQIDLGDDGQINELASLFEVSVAAMTYRIMRLFK